MAAHHTGPADPDEFVPYVPFSKRTVGDVDPQTSPERFAVADLRKEIAGLRRLNNSRGWHPLRAQAIERLQTHIAECTAGAEGPAEVGGMADAEQDLRRQGRCNYQIAYGDPAIGLRYCGHPADAELEATDLEGLCTRHGRQATGIEDPEINVGDRVVDTDPDADSEAGSERRGTVTAADNSGFMVLWDGQDTAYQADYGDITPVQDPGPAAGSGSPGGPGRTGGPVPGSGEVTGLDGAVRFTAGMARQSEHGASEVELAVSGLRDGGVTGPAVAALQQAMEALTQAAEAFRTASTELDSHMAVRDAYHANQGAGTREFLTQD